MTGLTALIARVEFSAVAARGATRLRRARREIAEEDPRVGRAVTEKKRRVSSRV